MMVIAVAITRPLVVAAYGGKPPAGYELAYHKARKAWTAKHKATKDKKPTHLKVLEEEVGDNTEDEDDSGTEDQRGFARVTKSLARQAGKSVAAPASASSPNRFAPLANGDDSEDGPLRNEDVALLDS